MFKEEGVRAFYSACIPYKPQSYDLCAGITMAPQILTHCDDFPALPFHFASKIKIEGITPRVARVAPGQAVVFAVYEKVKRWIDEVKSEINNKDFNEH
jgi:hypothetical protein